MSRQKQEFDFDQWYSIFTDCVRSLNYYGPIDQDSAKMDYGDGLSPEFAAETFVDEMTD